MSNFRGVISGISIDFFGSIVATIVSLAVIPWYFRYISAEEFGLWLAISGLSAMITMVDLGTDQYLTTVTSSDETFYSNNFRSNLTAIVMVKTAVTAVFVVIGTVLFLLLEDLIAIDVVHLESSKRAFGASIAILIFGAYFSTISTILYARRHYSLVSSFASIFSILGSFLTLLLMSLGFGIVSFPLAVLISISVQHLLLLIFMASKYPNVGFGLAGIRMVNRKELISYTTTFQVLRWVHTLRTQYISIVINNLSGGASVAQFNLTNRVPQMVPSYALKIVHPFFPVISDLFNRGEIESVRAIFVVVTKILSRLAVFFAIAVFLLNESFVSLWVGADQFAGRIILIWLVLYMLIYVAMGSFGIVIFASKKFGRWASWSVVEIIAAVILSYALSFQFGFPGIVAGFVLASLINQVYLFFLVTRQLLLKKREFLLAVLTYAINSNITVLIIGLGAGIFVDVNTWGTFSLVAFLLCISGFFADTIKILNSNELGVKNKIKRALLP